MYIKYSIDRGLRIIGGLILITLTLIAGGVETTGKITVIVIGLYAFITGIINFCPLSFFILKEKRDYIKEMKTSSAA